MSEVTNNTQLYINPFLNAIASGNLENIKELIEKGYSVNPFFSDAIPLVVAIEHNQYEAADLLISLGADVNVSSLFGNTPLALASELGDEKFVQLLLNAGATLDGSGALHQAVMTENQQMVSFLIAEGADVNEAFGLNALSPLHYAAAAGNIAIAEILLNSGADINIKGGYSGEGVPLVWAAEAGESAMVKYLIEQEANLNTFVLLEEEGVESPILSAHLTSALFNAIFSEDIATFNLLFNSGADKNLGLSPIHIETIQGDQAALLSLKSNNVEMNSVDTLGMKPIHYALMLGDLDVVESLIQLGADIHTPLVLAVDNGTVIDFTPLQIAALDHDLPGVQMLLDNGAQINQVNSQGEGALHILTVFDGAHEQATKIAELLIANGADVNAIDLDGNTPLHSVVGVHNVDFFKLLVECGADPYLKNNEGLDVFEALAIEMKQGAPQYVMDDYIEIQALLSEYELPRGNIEILSINDVIDLPNEIDSFKDGYGVISEINVNDTVPSEPYYSLNTVLSQCELQLLSGDLI